MASSAPAVEAAVRIIGVLARQTDSIGISEISRLSNINKNMVARVLQTLECEGWVSRDEHASYSLTLLPFRLTGKVVRRSSVAGIGIPILHEFWQQCGESTYLGVLHRDEVLYLSHFDSVQHVRVAGTIGGSYPLYCTGPGKALLAYLGEDYLDFYLEKHPLQAFTANTITDSSRLRHELAQIRARGYSLDNEEFGYGIVCLSVPIFDYTDQAVGVIGCSVSTVYCSIDQIFARYGEQLLRAAHKISRALGHL